jgi:hypothetical protein
MAITAEKLQSAADEMKGATTAEMITRGLPVNEIESFVKEGKLSMMTNDPAMVAYGIYIGALATQAEASALLRAEADRMEPRLKSDMGAMVPSSFRDAADLLEREFGGG